MQPRHLFSQFRETIFVCKITKQKQGYHIHEEAHLIKFFFILQQ